jgi:hypothetical protein
MRRADVADILPNEAAITPAHLRSPAGFALRWQIGQACASGRFEHVVRGIEAMAKRQKRKL